MSAIFYFPGLAALGAVPFAPVILATTFVATAGSPHMFTWLIAATAS